MAGATVLSIQSLTKNYGAVTVFSGISFQITEREHVALVGINGAGKSTMLRIVAGVAHADEGAVALTRGMKVTYLPQEARLDAPHGIMAETMTAFADLLALQTRIGEIEAEMSAVSGPALDRLMIEYAAATERFETGGGFTMEARAGQVLGGLGFTNEQFDTPVRQLSGGQKTRVALAKALLGEPDLLLLDEPTNHLDLVALEWLETFLRGYRHAVLVVSHDRTFLDRVTGRTLDLSFGRLEDYPGGYNRYVKLRGERMERRQLEFETQRAQIAKTEEFIRRYGAGQRSKEAKGREKRLARVERLERPKEPDKLRLHIATAVTSGRLVLTADRPLTVGYEDARGQSTALLKTPELLVDRGERVALVGPNGSGKSTLLKTLMREIPPLAGRFDFGTNVLVGYYAQSHEGLDSEKTVLGTVLDARPMSEEAARTLLGKFLFEHDDVFKQVAVLSGGERSRLLLAVLTLQKANFLILDEPTNHLDILAREALEDVLNDYEGTILFVSHDRAFIDALATQTWLVTESPDDSPATLAPYLGNYSEMRRTQERQRVTADERTAVAAVTAPTRVGKGASVTGNGTAAAAAKTDATNGAHGANGTRMNGAKPTNGTHTTNGTNGGTHGGNGTNSTHGTGTNGHGGANAAQTANAVNAARPVFDAKAYRTRQKLLSQVEARVNALEAELNRLNRAMNASEAPAKLAELGTAYERAQDELDTTIARWEALAAEVESMTAGATM